MSGVRYGVVRWAFLYEEDQARALDDIAELLADGWQLNGGPIALPGERVLQALVKPASNDVPLAAVPGRGWAMAMQPAVDRAALDVQSAETSTDRENVLVRLFTAGFDAGVIAAGGKA